MHASHHPSSLDHIAALPPAQGPTEPVASTASAESSSAGCAPETPPAASESASAGAQQETSPARARWKKFVRGRGRPMLLTEDIADAMYDAILEYGVTDSRAGLIAHVSTSTVSRWKQEHPIFADFLETARIAFEAEEVRKIRNARRRDGQFSPQNSKWLLERTNPARWGRPSTRSTPAHIDRPSLQPEDRNPNSHQSNFTQNIPEIPEPHASHPPRSDSQSVDSETAANLAQNQTAHAAAKADIAVPQGAQFHSTQQSKFPPNIPEIPQSKPQRAAAFVATQDQGPAPRATQIVPAKPVGVTPSSCRNYPPALAVKGLEEFLARLSHRRAA